MDHWDESKQKMVFTKDQSGQKIKAFPQIGNLVAHLLAGDYAYTGKVKMPSVEEMGEVIHDVDAGGIAGLRVLGYFGKGEKPSQSQVTAGLEDVHAFVMSVLPRDSREMMGYDLIMLEHALCKISRCRVNKWI